MPDNGSEISLFADDVAIYHTAKTKKEAEGPLQDLLDKIEEWAISWNFHFSVNKCASLTFTKKRTNETGHRFKLSGADISEVFQYKFLGITLDQKLSWEPHTKTIINKIQKRANLIRTLTYGKNTLKLPLLIRIFKAMIRSAYDYGSFVLGSMPKTRINKLNQAQNQILRIILGCLKSTPRALLKMETGIHPVESRWEQLAYRYLIRLNEKPWNPAYDTVQQLIKATAKWKPNSTPAAIIHLRKLDQTTKTLFKSPVSHTPEVEPLPPWKDFHIPTKYFPLKKKEALNSTRTAQIFLSLTSLQDPNHLAIYTDGSVCESSKTSTCAFYVPQHGEKKAWFLQKPTISFVAELYGIRQALYYLNEQEIPSVTIYTDSKSAVQAISNFKWEASPAVPEIINQIINLNSSGTQVTLMWIPSHAGIPGNEIADQLATEFHKNGKRTWENTIQNKIDINQTINHVKSKYNNITFKKLKTQTNNMAVTQRNETGILPWHINKKRNIQTAMLRLHSGHNKLNHFMSRLDPEIPDECPHGCPEQEDATHILLYCQEYSEARDRLERKLFPLNIPFDVPTLLGLNGSIPKHTQTKIVVSLFLLESHLIERI